MWSFIGKKRKVACLLKNVKKREEMISYAKLGVLVLPVLWHWHTFSLGSSLLKLVFEMRILVVLVAAPETGGKMVCGMGIQ